MAAKNVEETATTEEEVKSENGNAKEATENGDAEEEIEKSPKETEKNGTTEAAGE